MREAHKHAQQTGFDTLLIDTAGRLHIDDELMEELVRIKNETHPVEILFVADAMTGQDAVRSAEDFTSESVSPALSLQRWMATLAVALRFRSSRLPANR